MPKESKFKFDDPLVDEYSDTLKKTTIDLNNIWDRIGFNNETKITRYQRFYKKLIETCQGMLASEEDLEEEILDRINEHRQLMRTLTFELSIKYDENYAKGHTILDEEKLLRERVKQLQIEKKKRLDEFNALYDTEHILCDILKLKTTELKTNVPSESEIESIKSRIKELDKLKDERTLQMKKYKDEIMKLFHDLDISQSDSFSELIFTEEVGELPLSENDLQRAKDVLDELRKLDEKLSEKIKSTKYKIRQLWSKLGIENENLIELINNESSNQSNSKSSKSQIINMLDEEHERCLKIKMANMQKFIEQIRIEIDVYYEKLYFSESEIELFGEFYRDETFNEELLKIHEEKLEDLKFKYAESQSLYEKTAKWMELWQQFIVFEEKTKDPNRFKTRGYNALEEEKARKQFNTQFPKLEEDIYKYAEEYQRTNGGQTYQIYGIDWNQYISHLKNDYVEYKQNEKKEKQIIRDNKKVQEQNYGCKAQTPLKKLNSTKRKIDTTNLNMNTPNFIRSTKLQRTDDTLTPGTTTRKQTPKISKLKNTSKINRKSRTPMKQRLRRSKVMGKQVLSNGSSNVSSLSSASSNKMHATRSNTASISSSINTKSYKLPSNFKQDKKQQHHTTTNNDTTLTATSNTTTMTVSSKASSNSSNYRKNGYPFKNINTNDINYMEFTRDLSKPFRFNGATNSNKYHIDHDIKTKLTSTLIKE